MSAREYLSRFRGVSAAVAETNAQPQAQSATTGSCSDTLVFSFVTLTGISGISFGHNNTLVNVIQRKNRFLNYFAISYSAVPGVNYTIRIITLDGQEILKQVLPKSDSFDTKQMFELDFPDGFSTDTTRLLQVQMIVDPPFQRATFYSVCLGFK